MDLGCMDLGCLEKKKTNNGSSIDLQRKNGDDDDDTEESLMATAKFGKIKASKETAQSTLNAVNKSTLQIKKPHRKNPSPLNWFPRKKTDSYLKRKIRQLQEVGGMNSTLDETLGDSNPHYSRVLREKMAAKEAASKAMEARKAALVEASWCRILRAARIQSKEAESLLLEAEKNVDEAFEAAAALGVIMYDKPDCPQKPCEIASSVNVGGSTTHTVTASFETAFDVDKEVAAAVKTAFIRLANCPSAINKNECRDLLRRISQNPDTGESKNELSELSLECESDAGSELESDPHGDGFVSEDVNHEIPDAELKQRKCNDSRLPPINSMKLVDMMLERLKCLQDDELASLATIVATCGLNAALLEVENSKLDPLGSTVASSRTFTSLEAGNMKYSNMEYFKDPHSRRKQGEIGVPSLDKVLVKHMSRLEREVQEAKNTKKNEPKDGSGDCSKGSDHRVDDSNNTSSNIVPDLGSTLVKHACKLERDIEEAKKSGKTFEKHYKQLGNAHDTPDIPSLDKLLVRHMSKLEREVQEAKNTKKNEPKDGSGEYSKGSDHRVDDSNNTSSNIIPDLGSTLVKHACKLERDIEEAKKSGKTFEKHYKQLGNAHDTSDIPSLDKLLVRHVSKLEREVQEAKNKVKDKAMGESDGIKEGSRNKLDKKTSSTLSEAAPDLGSILIKHSSKLEKEIAETKNKSAKALENEFKQLGDKQHMPEVPSLDKFLVKHVSKLEREVQEAKSTRKTAPTESNNAVNSDGVLPSSKDISNSNNMTSSSCMGEQVGKENIDSNKQAEGISDETVKEQLENEKIENQHTVTVVKQKESLKSKYMSRVERAKLETLAAFSSTDGNGTYSSLDSVMVKPVHRLEREKVQALALGRDYGQKKKEAIEISDCESLDKVLVKHVSRLEKEKMVSKEEVMKVGRREPQYEKSVDSLDQVLVKHQSRLEKEKLAAAQQSGDQTNKHFETRREAKERELQQAWGGLSLGNSIRPSISRLEREKAAWIEAEEEERTQTATL